MQGAVQADEEILQAILMLHLAFEDTIEHDNGDGRFHGMAGDIGQADGQLAVLLKVLEEVAADVVSRETAAGDIEAINAGRLRRHQPHLHVVSGLQFIL